MKPYALLALLSATAMAAGANAYDAADPYEGVPAELLKSDHQDFRAALMAGAMRIDEWVDSVNSAKLDFICLGETHVDEHRSFFASAIFPRLSADELLLEETQPAVDEIARGALGGGEPSLLGAPIGPALRAWAARNPSADLVGIEQTGEQAKRVTFEQMHLKREKLSRDSFIAKNVLLAWKRNSRVVALIGSAHCSRLSEGLGFDVPFFRLLQSEFGERGARVVNARYVAPGREPVLRAFLSLSNIAVGEGGLALTRLASIPASAYNFRADLQNLFQAYDVLLVAP